MSTLREQEVFALFDRDADGYIPARDMYVAIRATGWNPSDKELDDLLTKELYSYEDFLQIVQPKLAALDVAKNLENSFKPFDRDGSGKISTAELKHVLLNLTEMGPLVDSMIEEVDPGNKGYIDYKAFVHTLLA